MRAKVTIDSRELDAAFRRLIRKASDQNLGRALEIGAAPIANRAKSLAPIKSGTLRRSITIGNWAKERGIVVVRVGTNLVYAAMHEFGGQIKVTPKMRAFLHYIGIHLRSSTSVINIPARPYLRPAFRQQVGKALLLIRTQLQRTVVDV